MEKKTRGMFLVTLTLCTKIEKDLFTYMETLPFSCTHLP